MSTIIYDERGLPIIFESSGKRYAIVTDTDKSVRYILSSNAKLVKEITRDPLGRIVEDSNPSFFFPLGFLSEFEDPLAEIAIIGSEARPLDLYLGRFMSTSISFLKPNIDVFRPEYEADPYRLKRNYIITPPLSKLYCSLLNWSFKISAAFLIKTKKCKKIKINIRELAEKRLRRCVKSRWKTASMLSYML